MSYNWGGEQDTVVFLLLLFFSGRILKMEYFLDKYKVSNIFINLILFLKFTKRKAQTSYQGNNKQNFKDEGNTNFNIINSFFFFFFYFICGLFLQENDTNNI